MKTPGPKVLPSRGRCLNGACYTKIADVGGAGVRRKDLDDIRPDGPERSRRPIYP